jgi:hypothetical protein
MSEGICRDCIEWSQEPWDYPEGKCLLKENHYPSAFSTCDLFKRRVCVKCKELATLRTENERNGRTILELAEKLSEQVEENKRLKEQTTGPKSRDRRGSDG